MFTAGQCKACIVQKQSLCLCAQIFEIASYIGELAVALEVTSNTMLTIPDSYLARKEKSRGGPTRMNLYETLYHVFSKLGKIKTAMALVVLFPPVLSHE